MLLHAVTVELNVTLTAVQKNARNMYFRHHPEEKNNCQILISVEAVPQAETEHF